MPQPSTRNPLLSGLSLRFECRAIGALIEEAFNGLSQATRSERLGAVLAVADETDLREFADLLLLEKLGPRMLQSLALVAEVVHGTPSRFSDPARFSFAHGGNDRQPFKVPLKTYDQSIEFLRRSLDAAKVGEREKLDGVRRLEGFVQAA